MRLNPFTTDVSWRERGWHALGGSLGVLGLAPFHVWPAMVAMFALMCVKLARAESARAAQSTAFWFGMGYFAAGMFWIGQAFIERGAAYIPLIVPLVLGLFVLLSLFWAVAGRVWWRFSGRGSGPGGVSGALSLAGLLWLAEYARGHLFGGFPWNLPGYAWEAGTALSQLASVVGVYGLSFLVMVSGTLLGAAWMARGRARVVAGGLALSLVALPFAFGVWRLGQPQAQAEVQAQVQAQIQAHVKAPADTAGAGVVRLVHVPFRQSEMMDRDRALAITNRYFAETVVEPLDGVTHIIWPEGAVRGEAVDNLSFLSVFPQAIGERPLPQFLFTSQRSTRTPGQGIDGWTYYNSAVAVAYPDGAPAVTGWTDKHRLVPFGEIVPFPADVILERFGLGAIAASFTPSPDKPVREIPGLGQVSVQICYEVIFSGLTEGAPSLILNQSNDAWFGSLHGPAQHAATARMRAVEEGVPLIRSAANGWSGTVDAWGRWQGRIGPADVGAIDLSPPAQTVETLFNLRIKYMLLLIILSATLLAIVAGRIFSRGAKVSGAAGIGDLPA